MRKHIILFFSALLFLFACNEVQTPKGILANDVFTRLLADVHIIDGSLVNEVAADSLYKHGTGRYVQVFKQYHTDSATFKKTMQYYSHDNQTMIAIYEGVSKIVKKKTDSITAIQNAIANKEMLRLQKQAKDVEKAKKDKEKAALLDNAKKDAKTKRDSINNAVKSRSAKENN